MTSGVRGPRQAAAALVGTALLLGACSTPAGSAESSVSSTSAPASSSPASTQSTSSGASIPSGGSATSTATGAQDVLDRWVADGSGGAVVATSENGGETALLAAGVSGPDGTPMAREALFRVGSLAKTFDAVMLLQLVGTGKLSLDQQVAEVYPQLAPQLPTVAGVTVRQLLDHSSGIPEYLDAEVVGRLTADPARLWTPQEVLATVADQPAGFVPGSTHEYSNTNYIVVGLLIEQLTGQSIQQNLEQRITGPLGLESTYFPPDPQRTPIDGWSKDFGTDTTQFSYAGLESLAWAAGALVSDAADLTTFLHAMVDGTLLSDELLAEMTAGMASSGYGLGIVSGGLKSGPALGNQGATPGFESVMAINPDTGETLVVLVNSDDRDVADLAEQLVLAG